MRAPGPLGDLYREAIGAPDRDRGGAWHMKQRKPLEFMHLSILDCRWRWTITVQTYPSPFFTERFDQYRPEVDFSRDLLI